MTLEVIDRLQAFTSAIRRTFVQYFTRLQLTARSRGLSATAGLLVIRAAVSAGYFSFVVPATLVANVLQFM